MTATATAPDLSRYVADVLALVERNRVGTSFVEISRVLAAAGLDVRGPYAIDIGSNVVIWGGVSESYIEVINAVKATERAHFAPTTPLVYLVDGEAMTLPVAKHPPAAGYREPRWAPAVLNAGPAPKAAKSRRRSA